MIPILLTGIIFHKSVVQVPKGQIPYDQIVHLRIAKEVFPIFGGFGYSGPPGYEFSTERPKWITKIPKGVSNPEYASFTYLGKTYTFMMEKSNPNHYRIWFDSNADGDLTDDLVPKWQSRLVETRRATNRPVVIVGKTWQQYGSSEIQIEFDHKPAMLSISMNLNEISGPATPGDYMFVTCDDGFTGSIYFGYKKYPIYFRDIMLRNSEKYSFPSLDLAILQNNDVKVTSRAESYNGSQSIKINGSEYKLSIFSLKDGTATFSQSDSPVMEKKMPPIWLKGARAFPFAVKNIEGKMVFFPEDYKGKLVLLRFWSYMQFLPHNLLSAYEKYHRFGFDVLGIYLGGPNNEESLKTYLDKYKIPWPEVYSGALSTHLSNQYGVERMPFQLLIDGTTGRVIAYGDQLNRDRLMKTLESAMRSLHFMKK